MSLLSYTPRRLTKVERELQVVTFATNPDEVFDERIMSAVWKHASDAARDPASIARSLPWNSFACGDNDDSSVVDSLLEVPLVPLRSVPSASGKPLYNCYANRYLPGIVERDQARDGRATNALLWTSDPHDYDSSSYQELARAHPGDDPSRNEPGVTIDYSLGLYAPVHTLAGSRVWSISFADQGAATVDLRACYPSQLVLRLDKARAMLMYDCFEFEPTTLEAFQSDIANNVPPCSETELKAVEKFLHSTRRERQQASMMTNFLFGDVLPSDTNDTTAQDPRDLRALPFDQRWRRISQLKLHYLINWIRFQQSRLLRVRFPLDAIVGARFEVFDTERPFEDAIPPAKGTLPLAHLGPDDPGEDEHDTRPGSFEICDDTIEPMGMLVLEFEAPLGGTSQKDYPFTSATLSHQQRRVPTEGDWTPQQACCRSRRHYITGDASEIRELCNRLCESSPRLHALLSPETQTDSQQEIAENLALALKTFNTLSGSLSILKPENTGLRSGSLQVRSAQVVLATHGIALSAVTKQTRQFSSKDDVHAFLRRCGVEEVEERVNCCIKAALLNGNLQVPKELYHAEDASSFLDTVLLTEQCKNMFCHTSVTCTVRNALYQFHRGTQDERVHTTLKCGGFSCLDRFITGICTGKPKFVRYNHNHCTKCPGFGTCIGFCRNRHCDDCGSHYTPGHDKCDCLKNKNFPASVDTIPVQPSSWDGRFRDTTLLQSIWRREKPAWIDSIRKQIAMFSAYELEDTNAAIKLFFPKSANDISCQMNMDHMNMEELGAFRMKINSIASILSTKRMKYDY